MQAAQSAIQRAEFRRKTLINWLAWTKANDMGAGSGHAVMLLALQVATGEDRFHYTTSSTIVHFGRTNRAIQHVIRARILYLLRRMFRERWGFAPSDDMLVRLRVAPVMEA